jgi:hypothetical protein
MKDNKMKLVEAQTYEQRLESLSSYIDHLPVFVERGKYANKDPNNNVQAVLVKQEGSYLVKDWIFGANIVTTDGAIYYAKMGADETPSANEMFKTGRMELRTGTATPADTDTYSAVTTPVTTSRKVIDTGYPKTNDTTDTDNTGDGVNVVSWRVSWTTGDFNATAIKGGCVHDNASPVAGSKLLTHWTFGAQFDKTASDTLKVFVNHSIAHA